MKTLEMAGDSKVRVLVREAPPPQAGQVIIETAASAICGSEMYRYRGDGVAGGNGGHEAVGLVAVLGDGVSNVAVGQRVGVSAVVGCGDCRQCDAGRYTWCDNNRSYSQMHAEQFVIPARACNILPDDLPWEDAALLTGDGMGLPYHTYKRTRDAGIQTVAVIGLGPIGLGNVLLQSHIGRRVIGVDIVDYRLKLAKQLGADVVVKSDDTLIERIRDLTGGIGADVAIMCAGRAEAVADAFLAARKGGTVVFNGELNQAVLAPSRDFIRRDITAIGCWYYHFHDFHDMLALYRNGLDIGKLITHQFPLSEADTAFDLFSRGLTGKVLLRPSCRA
ncbi:MAG: zinc-binding dehydrogenase [Chloroflexi bacterium]|nr:zinc-binding dehydrogenase [Chloroflexota bacterium]